MDRYTEYTSYLKLQWMIKKYGSEAVRHYFDNVIPPTSLRRILDENHNFLHSKMKNKPSFKILFPLTGRFYMYKIKNTVLEMVFVNYTKITYKGLFS